MSAARLDVAAIKRDFPILQERVNGGKKLIWLDNAATTHKPLAVIELKARLDLPTLGGGSPAVKTSSGSIMSIR